jgi:hypothetical protein
MFNNDGRTPQVSASLSVRDLERRLRLRRRAANLGLGAVFRGS